MAFLTVLLKPSYTPADAAGPGGQSEWGKESRAAGLLFEIINSETGPFIYFFPDNRISRHSGSLGTTPLPLS